MALDILVIDQVNNNREAVVAVDSPNQDTVCIIELIKICTYYKKN